MLAIEGGSPHRQSYLPYSCQSISADDKAAVLSVLDQALITRGPAVDRFENDLKGITGSFHAIAMTSATAGLHAVMSLLARQGPIEVFTSPLTFAATGNAVLYVGGSLRFVDIDPRTMNLSLDLLEERLVTRDRSKKSVVLAVDFAGNPCDYDRLRDLQNRFGFILVSDAAHSLGATYRGRSVGQWADYAVLSFHPVKSITTGEGGAVLCHSSEDAQYFREFRSHGIVRSGGVCYYEQRFLGFNYNMTDIQAALGSSQLKCLSQFVEKRNYWASSYSEMLKSLPLELPQVTEAAVSAWHLYPVRITTPENRDRMLQALHAENIGVNVHYIPVYWHPFYKTLGYERGLCPQAEKAYKTEISLPLFPHMTESDLLDVVGALAKVLRSLG